MIGIVGHGFVGKAIAAAVQDAEIYDKYLPEHANNLERTMQQRLVFVCVPTDLKKGTLDTNIVDEVVKQWARLRKPWGTLVIKSTIPIGTTERLIY